jgi:hypothetical protein
MREDPSGVIFPIFTPLKGRNLPLIRSITITIPTTFSMIVFFIFFSLINNEMNELSLNTVSN